MDDSVSDPQDQNPSDPDEILAASKFGAADDSLDTYANKAPWVGKIFLSYSSPDRTQTNGVRRLLTGMGHEVFHDHESIKAGSKWRTFLASGLEQSDCLAVFWTRHAQKSKWVAEEYETWVEMKPESPLIPIYGDPKVPLPPLLSERHVVDLGYAPQEEKKEKKGKAGLLLLGRGAWELAAEINGSIDTALGMADKLRKAGKSGAAVVQGVVSELKREGYPVPKPELIEEGLRDLGGLGWKVQFAANPLEPIKKPARWATEKLRQATPGAVAGTLTGALAAAIIGALMAPPAVQSARCRPLQSWGAPAVLTAGCPPSTSTPLPPDVNPVTPVTRVDNSTYNTSVLPYEFEREFRELRSRADIMLAILARLELNGGRDGRDGVDGRDGAAGRDGVDGGNAGATDGRDGRNATFAGWPFNPAPVTVSDWAVLLDRWEQDEERRWMALVAILEANQAQTDTILQALTNTREAPVSAGDVVDHSTVLAALVEGLDNQETRLATIESHLERLRLEPTDGEGRTTTIRNSGLGDLITRLENAMAQQGGVGGGASGQVGSDPAGPTAVPASSREVHYLLLPYSIGLAPSGVLPGDDGLGDARRKVISEDDDTPLQIAGPQAQVLMFPYKVGAVSVLGLEGSELELIIRDLHAFLLDPNRGDVYERRMPGRYARLLVLPYELDPLPPGLDRAPVQGVLDDVHEQLDLDGAGQAGTDEPRDEFGAPIGRDVELVLTPAQVRDLITPHVLASPARLMETFQPSAGTSGVGRVVDLGPVVALHNRTYEQLLSMDGEAPVGPGADWSEDMAILAVGQREVQQTLDSVLAKIAVLEAGGRGVAVITGPGGSASVATGADAFGGGPGPIRYVRPAGEGIFQAPQALDTLPPAYPAQAKADSLHGVVDVEAMIMEDGSVQVRRTASAAGLAVLEQAAADQVAKWLFEPGTLNGDAIAVPLRVSLSFELGAPQRRPNDF